MDARNTKRRRDCGWALKLSCASEFFSWSPRPCTTYRARQISSSVPELLTVNTNLPPRLFACWGDLLSIIGLKVCRSKTSFSSLRSASSNLSSFDVGFAGWMISSKSTFGVDVRAVGSDLKEVMVCEKISEGSIGLRKYGFTCCTLKG